MALVVVENYSRGLETTTALTSAALFSGRPEETADNPACLVGSAIVTSTSASFTAASLTIRNGYVVVGSIDEPVYVHIGAVGSATNGTSAFVLAGQMRRFLISSGQTVNVKDYA
jgi:hypothetical protein